MILPIESFRDYLHDLRIYEGLPREARRVCAQAAAAWLEVLPELAYYGESPCWRADCPLCGVRGELWVVPLNPTWWGLRPGGFDLALMLEPSDDRWQCYGCGARGADPASLAKAIAHPPGAS